MKKQLKRTRIKKKPTKAEFLRSWGLPPTFQWRNLRYKNPPEKGVFWYYVSLYVRHRDVAKYGVCISCGKPITVDSCDAGHYCPASSCGRDLLFDLDQLSGECKRCNGFDEGHLIGYRKGLITRYGEQHVLDIERRYQEYKTGPPIKDWKASEYGQKIKEIQQLLEQYR